MARIYPFQGYRYNPEKIKPLDAVVTQPYDKISESQRQDYLNRHPANIVRVIKNEDYEEAAGFIRSWEQDGTLVQDSQPALYAYEQLFQFEGETLSRIGFIGLVGLEDREVVVRGHEKVLDGPLADRLNLIRATRANEGLVFTLFSDPELRADRLLEQYTERESPSLEVRDDYGVINRIWVIPGGETVSGVVDALDGLPLYIADGHHRFKTAQVYCRECRDRGLEPLAVESFDKRMVALFNMESEGVRILATHRGVRPARTISRQKILAQLEQDFRVEERPDPSALWETVQEGESCLGWLSRSALGRSLECRALFLQERRLEDSSFMPDTEGPARELDVNLLHEGVLSPIFGIGSAELASQKYVDYFRDRDALVEGVRQGDFEDGFLLKPTSLEQVRKVSDAGFKMPQKSTDFFPKLLTGLVLMQMQMGGKE